MRSKFFARPLFLRHLPNLERRHCLRAQLLEHLAQRIAEREKSLEMRVRWERLNTCLGPADETDAGRNRFIQRAIARAVFQNLGYFFAAAVENKTRAALALEFGRGAQKNEHRQRELAFAQIGSERFSGCAFISRDIEAVVINLISGAHAHSEIFQNL